MQPCAMPPKLKEGTMPLNSLPATRKYVTFCHADKAAGRLPVRELPDTSKASNPNPKALASSDTVPRRLLPHRSLRRREERRSAEKRRGGVSAGLPASAPPARHAAAGGCAHVRDGGTGAVYACSAATRILLRAALAVAIPLRPASAVEELPPRGALVRREARGSAGAAGRGHGRARRSKSLCQQPAPLL